MAAKKKITDPTYVELTDYILMYYLSQGYDKSEIDWHMITAQIKNMREEDKSLQYITIKYILYYMAEVEGKNLLEGAENGSILNLVPFYYNKAMEYYYNDQHIREVVETFDFNDDVVVVKKSSKKSSKYKDIDLTSLM